jgi:hypothetical protein
MPANTANQNARALLGGMFASMEGVRESARNAGAGGCLLAWMAEE